jgi:hypothetical protein
MGNTLLPITAYQVVFGAVAGVALLGALLAVRLQSQPTVAS